MWLAQRGAPLLDAADLYVSMSLSESFGLAVLEGMSRGLPVIGFYTAGFDEFFLPEIVGELVDPVDPVRLGQIAARWLSDPSRRAASGRRAVERAAQFTVSQTADQMADFHRRAAASRRSR